MASYVKNIWQYFVPPNPDDNREPESIADCPPLTKECARWAYRVPVFYLPEIMLIIYEYVDTKTAVDLPRVFPMLRVWAQGLTWDRQTNQLVQSADPAIYWNQRFERMKRDYEQSMHLPYGFNIACYQANGIWSNDELVLEGEFNRQTSVRVQPEPKTIVRTKIPGILLPAYVDKQKGNNNAIFGNMDWNQQRTNLDQAWKQWGPIQKMIVHEFYAEIERRLFRYIPSSWEPMSTDGTVIRIGYGFSNDEYITGSSKKNCELVQFGQVFNRDTSKFRKGYTDIIVRRPDGDDGDTIEYEFQMSNEVSIKGGENEMRKFIHATLPMIRFVHATFKVDDFDQYDPETYYNYPLYSHERNKQTGEHFVTVQLYVFHIRDQTPVFTVYNHAVKTKDQEVIDEDQFFEKQYRWNGSKKDRAAWK